MIETELTCKSYGINDMCGAGIVSGYDKFLALFRIRYQRFELGIKSFYHFYGSGNVVAVYGNSVHGQTVGFGSCRHQLHDASSSGPGHLCAVVVAFGKPHGGEQAPVPPYGAGIFAEEVVER